MFALGDRISTPYSRADGKTCGPSSYSAQMFRVGTAIPPTSFLPVAHATFGGWRLQVVGVDIDHRLYVDPLEWIDEIFLDVHTGRRCTMVPVGPEAVRCIPSKATTSVLYLDAACTVPAAEHWDGSPVPELALVRDGDVVRAVHRVFGSTRRQRAYRRRSGTCWDIGETPVIPLGEEVPLEQFAPARIGVE